MRHSPKTRKLIKKRRRKVQITLLIVVACMSLVFIIFHLRNKITSFIKPLIGRIILAAIVTSIITLMILVFDSAFKECEKRRERDKQITTLFLKLTEEMQELEKISPEQKERLLQIKSMFREIHNLWLENKKRRYYGDL